MTTFWQLFRESVIIQGFITLACIGAMVYLTVTGQPVPEALSTVVYLVTGFYFGAKSVSSARESAIAVANAMNKNGNGNNGPPC